MLKSIKIMLDAFEQNNIKYCHWKSNEHLEEALTGDTDLDMLFSPSQRSLLDKILNECGLKHFRAMPLMQYNAIEDYIGFDKETAKIWHLHLHYRMTLGEPHLKGYTITPYTDYILDSRVMVKEGIYTSAPAVEYILLLIRMTLKLRTRDWFRKVSKDDLVEQKWLIEHSDKEGFEKHAKEMLHDEKAVSAILSLYGSVVTGKNQLRPLRKQLLRVMRPFTCNSLLKSRWLRTKREIFWLIGGVGRRMNLNPTKPFRRVSPAGGCVVAFLGCDGAGKSTTLDYLYHEYKKKLDVKTIYLGSGDGSSSLLRKPMKMVARRVGGKGLGHQVEKEYQEKKKVSLKSRLYSIAKILWAVTLAKEKKGKLREMTKARNLGMLVLTDRYPQIVMPGYSDGPLLTKYLKNGKGLFYRIAKWEYGIYESSTINAPDLTVKLMVPTETAIQRKPEMTAEEIDNKKAAVMAINVSRSVVVDTSHSKEETLGDIMEYIWEII